ncbi:MAG TPA: hypothetical protein VMG60_14480 [Burkholderiaceae bacterium]|nr:hypothetical protein [Burkholderiaceae bacterium]
MLIGAWLMLIGGIVCLAIAAKRRDWLLAGAWACAIPAALVRLAPVPAQAADRIYLGLGVVFALLNIVWLVRIVAHKRRLRPGVSAGTDARGD